MDNQTDSKFAATSKQRKTPDQTKLGEDLPDTLNSKQNKGGDLHAKHNVQRVTAISKIVHASSVVCTTRSKQREAVPKYETPFSQDNKRMNLPEKFTTLRSYVSHIKQMMAL